MSKEDSERLRNFIHFKLYMTDNEMPDVKLSDMLLILAFLILILVCFS